MIAIDTNVLVRLFVDDNEEQHRASLRFFDERTSDDPAFINCVVLAEFAWVLKRSYGYPGASVNDAVEYLTATTDIRLHERAAVLAALSLSRELNMEFADAFIACLDTDAGCSTTVTFDRRAAKAVPGMELLA